MRGTPHSVTAKVPGEKPSLPSALQFYAQLGVENGFTLPQISCRRDVTSVIFALVQSFQSLLFQISRAPCQSRASRIRWMLTGLHISVCEVCCPRRWWPKESHDACECKSDSQRGSLSPRIFRHSNFVPDFRTNYLLAPYLEMGSLRTAGPVSMGSRQLFRQGKLSQ